MSGTVAIVMSRGINCQQQIKRQANVKISAGTLLTGADHDVKGALIASLLLIISLSGSKIS